MCTAWNWGFLVGPAEGENVAQRQDIKEERRKAKEEADNVERERQAAQARAAQAANSKIASDQRRRRSQNNLLALGGKQASEDPLSGAGAEPQDYGTEAEKRRSKTGTLLASGAPASASNQTNYGGA